MLTAELASHAKPCCHASSAVSRVPTLQQDHSRQRGTWAQPWHVTQQMEMTMPLCPCVCLPVTILLQRRYPANSRAGITAWLRLQHSRWKPLPLCLLHCGGHADTLLTAELALQHLLPATHQAALTNLLCSCASLVYMQVLC